MAAGENNKKKSWVREKKWKRGKKKEENYIKNGGKSIKNAYFWVINPKKLITGENIGSQSGGGGMIEIYNKYPCIIIIPSAAVPPRTLHDIRYTVYPFEMLPIPTWEVRPVGCAVAAVTAGSPGTSAALFQLSC